MKFTIILHDWSGQSHSVAGKTVFFNFRSIGKFTQKISFPVTVAN